MKRFLSGLLVLVLCLGLLPAPAQAASSYDSAKALSYAKSHWDDGKGLCAEFVSDCLKAGGLSAWNRECTNLYNELYKEVVNGAKTASVQYLKTSGNYIKTSDNKGKVAPGDVLFWLCSGCPTDSVGGPYQHTALVSSVSGTYVNVYQHNGAVNNQPAWVGTCYECGRAYSHMVAVHFGSAATATPSSITFSPSSIAMNPGESKNVSISFQGDGISSVYFGEGDRSVCTAKWNGKVDWSKRTASLTITAQAPGTATVSFGFKDKAGNEYFHRGIRVTVNDYSTSLSASPSSVSLDLASTSSQTVTVTLGGNFPSDAQLGVDKEGVAKVSWISDAVRNNQAQLKVYAEETGTGRVTFKLMDCGGAILNAAAVHVTATAPTYTVTYDANGGSGAPPQQVKEYNKPITISNQIPTRAGYRFNGWSVYPSASSSNYTPGSTYSTNLNLQLYAVWAPASGVQYTVKHYLKDETGTHLEDTDVFTGSTEELVAPSPRTYPGYASPEPKSAQISADGSTLIEYTYTAIFHMVHLNDDWGIALCEGQGNYQYGSTVTVRADVKEGYAWRQWEAIAGPVPSSVEQVYTFTMPNEDVILRATSEEIPEPDCGEGHTWGEWVETMESTCVSEGRMERSCTVCGETETSELPPLEHDYIPKQETEQYIFYFCPLCGDTYLEEKELPPAEPEDGRLSNFTDRNTYYPGLFLDVASSHWSAPNIAAAYELGLMNGTGSGCFSPDNNVTLAEAITLAARIHSIYYTGEEDFPRYDGGNWYDPYVNYARDQSIITENYAYTRPATREEFVHIMAAALPEEALPSISETILFTDTSDIIYSGDVRLLQRAGVISGIQGSDGIYFKPWNPITRGEVAAIVTRMVDPTLRKS